ncbi:MAG: hypothetical protein J0G96_09620 [Flavobacteriia bacterium]|nr:hypothetical protein [Flavobacteriia bacterium]OJX34699.1 MAG: hypothetical protein BGO87_08295 [Flavobacteriia bacterium 40-80]
MKRLNLFFTLAILFIFAACSKKSNEKLQEVAGNYFSGQADIIGFGKISIGQIRDQSKIETVPFFGEIVKKELSNVQSGIDIADYVYFGIQAKDETDFSVTAFAKVANADSLNKYLKERGNTVSKDNNLYVTEEDEMVLVFDENMIALRAGKNNSKADFIKTFKALKSGTISNENIAKALDKDAPFVVALLADKYQKLNPNEEYKQLMNADLYKDVIQCMDIKFNKGNIELTSEFIADKAKLKKLDFVNNSGEAKSLKISGTDIFYFVLNADFSKVEKENKKLFDYLMGKLDEELAEYKEMDEEELIYKSKQQELLELSKKFISRDHPLTSLSNGVFFLTAEQNKENYKMPHLNFYLGSSNKGMKEYLAGLIKTWDPSSDIKITDNTIQGTIFKAPKAIKYSKNTDINGNVLKLFLDMNYVTSVLEQEENPSAYYTKPIKSVEAYSKENIAKLTINMNDASTNGLETLVKHYTSQGQR